MKKDERFKEQELWVKQIGVQSYFVKISYLLSVEEKTIVYYVDDFNVGGSMEIEKFKKEYRHMFGGVMPIDN